jgi:cellulose synthase (UDP-forming)
MPHVFLLVLNVTAIAVGVTVMTDPAPTWLSVGWATMIVLVLGRMIIESVRGGGEDAKPPVATPVVPRQASEPAQERARTPELAAA